MKTSLNATSVFRSLVVFLTVLVPFSHQMAHGQKSVSIPPGSAGLVVYGSLMSVSSMEQTLGHQYTGPVLQIHLKDYQRSWTHVRPLSDPQAPAAARRMKASVSRDGQQISVDGFVQLNIQPSKGSRINAILYVVTADELVKLDAREYGYRRVDVTDKIEELGLVGAKAFAYEGLPEYTEASAPKGTYLLIQEFADSVTAACDALGKTFREEFDRSTKPSSFQVVPVKSINWEKVEQPT